MAHIRELMPDSSLSFQVQILQRVFDAPTSLGSGGVGVLGEGFKLQNPGWGVRGRGFGFGTRPTSGSDPSGPAYTNGVRVSGLSFCVFVFRG